MATILLAAIRLGGTDPLDAAKRAAHGRGREIGRGVRGVLRPGKLGRERALRLSMQALNQQGYEPEALVEPAQTQILLRNCPFHRLLTADRLLVCTINRELVDGILTGLDSDLLDAALIPREAHCCVTVTCRPGGAGGADLDERPPGDA